MDFRKVFVFNTLKILNANKDWFKIKDDYKINIRVNGFRYETISAKIEIVKKQFIFLAPRIFNDLDSEVRNEKSSSVFKKKILSVLNTKDVEQIINF